MYLFVCYLSPWIECKFRCPFFLPFPYLVSRIVPGTKELTNICWMDSHFVVCKIRALDLTRWFLRTIHILWITQTSLESDGDRQITQRESDLHAALERKLRKTRAHPGKEKFSTGNCRCKDRSVFGVLKKWQGRGCGWSSTWEGGLGTRLGGSQPPNHFCGEWGWGSVCVLGVRGNMCVVWCTHMCACVMKSCVYVVWCVYVCAWCEIYVCVLMCLQWCGVCMSYIYLCLVERGADLCGIVCIVTVWYALHGMCTYVWCVACAHVFGVAREYMWSEGQKFPLFSPLVFLAGLIIKLTWDRLTGENNKT